MTNKRAGLVEIEMEQSDQYFMDHPRTEAIPEDDLIELYQQVKVELADSPPGYLSMKLGEIVDLWVRRQVEYVEDTLNDAGMTMSANCAQGFAEYMLDFAAVSFCYRADL